jgi:uncharacterized protein (UPF0332 family)
MMRSPELQYCLDSPYLWYDETSPAMVQKDLDAAEKFLKESKDKKDAIDQLNTAYQSMFCSTQALLHSIGYKSAGFRCIVTVLEEFFLKRGILDRVHIDHLLRSQRLEGTAQENIEAADAYWNAVKSILKK